MQNTLRYPRRCQCKYAQQDREFEAELGNNGKVNYRTSSACKKGVLHNVGLNLNP